MVNSIYSGPAGYLNQLINPAQAGNNTTVTPVKLSDIPALSTASAVVKTAGSQVLPQSNSVSLASDVLSLLQGGNTNSDPILSLYNNNASTGVSGTITENSNLLTSAINATLEQNGSNAAAAAPVVDPLQAVLKAYNAANTSTPASTEVTA